MLAQVAVLTLALPALVSGALFPPNGKVKSIDAKGFRKAMSTNDTSIVAFVAPWCGHCQRMAPELSKAAKGLDPLVPVYAVDCDAEQNKPLCAQQGVQGFPTVKIFPRGKSLPPKPFDGQDRIASEFFSWAERSVPSRSKKLYETKSIEPWISENTSHDRLLLLTKAEKVPLLWSVLANKFRDNFKFAYHRDRKGKSSVALGFEAGGEKESKLLVYPKGSTTPVRYDGLLKLDPLSKFFNFV
ncbi:disulfide isomerase [Peniophora sp. CONT]|nr:disulfide isomerase [Peniophora sp. CONT]